MTELVPPVGPVDVAVIGFPGPDPDGTVREAVAEAVVAGAVRVLDALVIRKDGDGEVSVADVDDSDEAATLLGYEVDFPGLLSEADAVEVGDELPPGTSAVIIAWENVWPIRLRQALADADAVVALHERIDVEQLVVAVQAVVGAEDA